MHLGYSISSGDRADIVKSAKGVVGLALIPSSMVMGAQPILSWADWAWTVVVFPQLGPSWELLEVGLIQLGPTWV